MAESPSPEGPRGQVGLRARQHAVAALVALVWVVLLVAATPGLDAWGRHALKSDKQLARVERKHGEVVAGLARAIADWNRRWRIPLSARLTPLERVFRIKQAWHLYGSGPFRNKRLEVRVDGDTVYRSRDDAHAWRASQLEYRRIRPMAATLALKSDAFNWKGLGRFFVEAVREDFPDATEVLILGTVSPKGEEDPRPVHGRVAEAPDWELLPLEDAQITALQDGRPWRVEQP